MTDAELAQTKELAFWMTERVFMNPISAKFLNEDWRKAFPDEVAVAERMKALVEALEKAQQHIARQEQILLNQDESLSIRRGELEAAHQRIGELESRTVKLPESFRLAKSSSGLTYYYADEVDAALTAAGIKVEAE
ncbi:hypothetical protein VBQ43_10455 [Klebsiella pneumoniae]|nr:hypothetical protein [Klebsiella pneumoniae]